MRAETPIIHQLAHKLRAAAICATESPGWARLLMLPRGQLDRDKQQIVTVAISFVKPEKLGEIVRLHFNLPDGMAEPFPVRALIRMELEPFIVGVGKVSVQETVDGLVIVSLDKGDGVVHDSRS
jgi:hypothetical protein